MRPGNGNWVREERATSLSTFGTVAQNGRAPAPFLGVGKPAVQFCISFGAGGLPVRVRPVPSTLQ